MKPISGAAAMKPILAWCTALIPLLASSLALALTTSPPQKVPPPGTTTPPPGTTPCDIGPSYTGSIPAAAAAAGFTHCVANYDFTQTGSFTTNGNTYQWAVNPQSTWLACPGHGSSTSTPWLLWEHDYGLGTNCADFIVTTDSACGNCQVLQVKYLTTDTGGNTWINSDSPDGLPNPPGIHIKHGFYVETLQRVAGVLPNSTTKIYGLTQAYQIGDTCSACDNIGDLIEFYDGSSPYAQLAGPAYPSGFNLNSAAPGYASGQYVLYGMLDTVVNSNSGNNYQYCGVINNTSPSARCNAIHQDLTTIINPPLFDTSLQWLGPELNGTGYVQSDEIVNIQRMTIWACAGYTNNTGGNPCYTSSLISY
jgi:hypothetical protein